MKGGISPLQTVVFKKERHAWKKHINRNLLIPFVAENYAKKKSHFQMSFIITELIRSKGWPPSTRPRFLVESKKLNEFVSQILYNF